MPILDELRNRWFLNFNNPNVPFPPMARHKGTHVKDYTDGNLVTPLVEGQNYMKKWRDRIVSMVGLANCEVYHAAWRIEDVRTLGQSKPASNALDTIIFANAGGVKYYLLICGNIMTIAFNSPSYYKLTSKGVSNAAMDYRFPPNGSNHQKFVCFKNPDEATAVLGSIDISKTRWDRGDHAANDPERDPKFGKPTHDIGVMIQGPAVADIEWSFIERWNDKAKSYPEIKTPVSSPVAMGDHSIQVLHTYGIASTKQSYSWAPTGEFTIWASYLNAIKKASKYIYIEDQYFLPFDYPPCFLRSGNAWESDLVTQLGIAILKGVKVFVMVPSNAEDSTHGYQKYQRDLGINYLKGVAGGAASGDFVVASPHNGQTWIYVHSKLMICDDEFVLIGSANVGQRSMTHDSELSIGIVDKANQFAMNLRKQLWTEHLTGSNISIDSIADPRVAYDVLKNAVASKKGRLRPYDSSSLMSPDHPLIIRRLIDPYAGPPR